MKDRDHYKSSSIMKDRDLEVINRWTIEVHHHNFTIHIVNIKILGSTQIRTWQLQIFLANWKIFDD